MNVQDFKPEGTAYDLSGIIMHQCICGSDMWKIVVTFDNYQIAGYMLDMECFYCGTRATAPTEIDDPDYEEYND